MVILQNNVIDMYLNDTLSLFQATNRGTCLKTHETVHEPATKNRTKE